MIIPLTRNSWIDFELLDSSSDISEIEPLKLHQLSNIAEIMKAYPKLAIEFHLGDLSPERASITETVIQKALAVLRDKGVSSNRLAFSIDRWES